MSRSKFEKMVAVAEAGQEIACQSYQAGYTAIWYKTRDTQYQVQYEAGEPTSIQVVGTKEILFSE